MIKIKHRCSNPSTNSHTTASIPCTNKCQCNNLAVFLSSIKANTTLRPWWILIKWWCNSSTHIKEAMAAIKTMAIINKSLSIAKSIYRSTRHNCADTLINMDNVPLAQNVLLLMEKKNSETLMILFHVKHTRRTMGTIMVRTIKQWNVRISTKARTADMVIVVHLLMVTLS